VIVRKLIIVAVAAVLAGATLTSSPATPAAADVPIDGTELDDSQSRIIEFETLSFAAQVALLESYCSTLSNGVVVFTCEDELAWLASTQAAVEATYELLELANFAIVNGFTGDDLDVDKLASAIVADVADEAGAMTSDEAIANYVASISNEGTGEEITTEELLEFTAGPVTVVINTPTTRVSIPFPVIKSVAAKVKCGFFGKPKPKRPAQWVNQGYVEGPETYLASQGYHKTPRGRMGGGWTRPQTYLPLLCGWNTYRDHAQINYTVCIVEPYRACQVGQQVYSGDPGGEPNVELHRSGPWPYLSWPAYVMYWHRFMV
jgi:hypothetical protein